ncbi:MAG: MBL fold metallo-hydrolase [Thermoprotei archaeon]
MSLPASVKYLGEIGTPQVLVGYLVTDSGVTAMIESGPSSCVEDYLFKASLTMGSKPNHIAVSHIHVDHSGGAWRAVEKLPEIKISVYEKGYPYLVNPGRLIESAKQALGAIYEIWGEVRAVPEHAVVSKKSGDTLAVGSKTLKLMDAPGHAPHSSVWYLESERVLFCGDSLGIYLGDSRKGVLWPTTPPPSYDHGLALDTIHKLSQLKVESVCFPHYGYNCDTGPLFDQIKQAYVDWHKITKACFQEGLSAEETLDVVLKEVSDYRSVCSDPYRKRLMLMDVSGVLMYHRKHQGSGS